MIPLIPRERWPYSEQIKLWLDKLLSSSLDLSLGNNFFISVCLSSCFLCGLFSLVFSRYLTSFPIQYVHLNEIFHGLLLFNDFYWKRREGGDGIYVFLRIGFKKRKKKDQNKWNVKKSDFKVKLTTIPSVRKQRLIEGSLRVNAAVES